MRLTCNDIIYKVHNYYPFGGIIDEGSRRGADVQNHLYNGKELDRMHGLNLYDYSARQYDATLGQFTSMDPLCEVDYHTSPYAYCGGDPVNRVDKDGRIWNFVIGAAIGAATDYVCQVSANAIANGGLSAESFTDVDSKQILLAAGAGAISSGASAIGASVAKTVATETGSQIAGKVVGKVAAEGTEFVANVVANKGNVNNAVQDYAFGKAFKSATNRNQVSPTSNNKAVKAATENARSKGKSLSAEQKNAVRKNNSNVRKNASKTNKSVECNNALKNEAYDLIYGTNRKYNEKTDDYVH